MYLNLDARSALLGAPKPPQNAKGNLQIDWVTVYSYEPRARATSEMGGPAPDPIRSR
jgi:hypothetical protein